jgi:hypothetical protein
MSKSPAKRDPGTDRDRLSRPEDHDTQRLKRGKRLLRNDMLPDGAAMITQAEDERDGETEAALKRATDDREREEPT